MVAPSEGGYKLNIDASMGNGSTSFSMGMVLRNSYMSVFERKNMMFEGTVSVVVAESIGVQEALSWILSMQVQHVTIETDSQLTVKALKNVDNRLELGNIIQDCCSML